MRAWSLIVAGGALAGWAITKTDARAYLAVAGAVVLAIGLWLLAYPPQPLRRDSSRRPGYIYDHERDR